jgi:hypothetical protein
MKRYDIPAQPGLDPIIVLIEQPRAGALRLIIQCYDRAWHGFWGSIGAYEPEFWLVDKGPDYLLGNLLSGLYGRFTKAAEAKEELYLTKIVIAVQRHLGAQPKAAPIEPLEDSELDVEASLA